MDNKSEQPKYIITIKGPGMSFETPISGSIVAPVMQLVLGGNTDSVLANTNNTNISPREFLNQKKASSNSEKILVFAAYMKEAMKKDLFSSDEILVQFEKSNEQTPSNFSRDFKNTISYGWISESPSSPGRFYVTSTGLNVVQSGFKETNKKRKAGKGGTTKFSPTLARKEVLDVELSPNMPEMKPYWNLGSKGEKVLWILVESKLRGIDDLNYKEVSKLASMLGDDISVRVISGSIETQIKKGRVIAPIKESTRFLRVLQPGIDYIKNGLERQKGEMAEK